MKERPDQPTYTSRERQVLQLVRAGLSSQAIAKRLGRSVRTVEHFRAKLHRKHGTRTPAELYRATMHVRPIRRGSPLFGGLTDLRTAPRGITLTPREWQVLELLWQGFVSREIGRTLKLSPRTIEVHRRNILLKTKTKNIAQMLRMALMRGWIHTTTKASLKRIAAG